MSTASDERAAAAESPAAGAWPPVERDRKSALFFEGATREELAIRHCRSCEHHLAPEAVACTACGGSDLAWTVAAGEGQLVSWTVVTRPPNPAFAELVPYAVGIVELDEGPWLYMRIEGAEGEELSAGRRVRIGFVHPEAGDSYPVCRLAGETSSRGSL